MTRTRIAPAESAGTTTWVQQYEAELQKGRLSMAAVAEIRRCTELAFSRIPSPRDGSFNEDVVGAFVGAVQSGKTSLMVHLAARALDEGFRVVVVLAGLRDDLRTQTARRFIGELLQRGDPVPGAGSTAFTHPLGEGYHGALRHCWSPRYSDDVNHDEAFTSLFRSRLRRGDMVLAVAKKNVASLTRLREAYHFACAGGDPLPLLVLDDECDEASVSGDPDAPTPERIAHVWSGLGQSVAYVGVTATPAANLLQDTESDLFPKDFAIAMRSPGDDVSAVQYLEMSPDSRYTGGHVFYELLESRQRRNFFVRSEMSRAEFDGSPGASTELEESLIAYFVSGAMRLMAQPDRALDGSKPPPPPHTMLAHTESLVESHWRLCDRIIQVVQRFSEESGRPPQHNIRRVRPEKRLHKPGLEAWLAKEPARWQDWHTRFQHSLEDLLEVTPDRDRAAPPSWEEVRSLLPHVFEHTKLRVVNSDEDAVDPPLQFSPSFSDGEPVPPIDVYSIIIGGNRLSRGLTIEGLCISYYTRTASTLLEDTTVQRERWFGYRGPHLGYCRLFTHRSLALRLRRFHEHDEDLRTQLAWQLENHHRPDSATLRFLTLRGSLPTAKLGRGEGPLTVSISGSRPFVDRVQMGESSAELQAASGNQAIAAEMAASVLKSGDAASDKSGNTVAIVWRDRTSDDVARILERFSYTFHNPDPASAASWDLMGFYRQPLPDYPITSATLPPRSDPLLIAAYLRFWEAAYKECSENPTANRYRANDSISPWRPRPAPKFSLAVRYGSLPPTSKSPFEFPLLNRAIGEDGVLGSRWGGRGYASSGDEWIDWRTEPDDQGAPREAGAAGLALLHVIGAHATGISDNGQPYEFDRPCFGIVVPLGGPCIHAVVARGKGTPAT